MQNKVDRVIRNIRLHSTLLTLLTLAVVLFSIPLTVVVLQSEQDIRQEAAGKKESDKKEKKRERAKRKKHAPIPGKIIFRFSPPSETSIQAATSTEGRLREKYGAAVERKDNLNIRIIRVKPGQEQQVIDDLIEDPNVEFVEQGSYVYLNLEPNDQNFQKQWGLQKIGAPAAWDTTEGKDSITIAILDTGIDESHPDLQDKILVSKSKAFAGTKDKGSVQDKVGHGTHVAGIAAASTNNKEGVAGVCPNCKIMNVRVMPGSGERGDETDVAEGIRYAVDNGANVINLSVTGPDDMGVVNEAIDYAVSKGVLVVAAAGNCGDQANVQGNPDICPALNATGYPAAYQKSLAVASVDTNDNRSSFSNHGTYVDIAAPGSDILSTAPTYPYELQNTFSSLKLQTKYATLGGTSMAAPMVSGLAGLLMSEGMSAQQARNAILASADKIQGTGKLWENGRINAKSAVATKTDNSNDEDSSSPDPCITPEETDTAKNADTTDKAERPTNKAPKPTKVKGKKTADSKKSGSLYERAVQNAQELRNKVFGGSAKNSTSNKKTSNTNAKKEARAEKRNTKSRTTIQARITSNPCEPSGNEIPSEETAKKSDTAPKPTKTDATDKAARREARGKAPRPTRTKNKMPKQNSGTDGNAKEIAKPGTGGVTRTVERTCEPATVKTPGGVTTIPCDESKIQSVSVLEYNTIIDCFSDEEQPKACTPEKFQQADLNKDGKVNQLDYNLFLSKIRRK